MWHSLLLGLEGDVSQIFRKSKKQNAARLRNKAHVGERVADFDLFNG